MPNSAVVIRYPDGDFEYVVSPTFEPTPGTKIERKNARWVVAEVVESSPTTIYLAPESTREVASGR